MKKTVLLIIMTATLLTLAGCNTNNNDLNNTSVVTSTSNEIETANTTNDLISSVVVDTEIITKGKFLETGDDDIPEETRKNMMSRDSIVSSDAVIYDITKTDYNKAGGIEVEGFLVNVSDHDAGLLRLVKLELVNENDEIIASNAFGYILEYGVNIKSGEKLAFSFTFPSINVLIKDDDLDSVKPVSRFSNKH